MQIPKDIYDAMIAHAQEGFPLEVCGYLGGVKENGEICVRKHYRLTNTDKSNEHFTMDPKEQFETFKDAKTHNLSLLVCYHSHPESPARPSDEDIRLAYDPNINYTILSLQERNAPVMKAFWIKNGQVSHEEIKII